jgi:hypothetical protein
VRISFFSSAPARHQAWSIVELSCGALVSCCMKLKWIVLTAGAVLVTVVSACLAPAQGGDGATSTPFIVLSSVPVPEIPAKAADLVHAAAASDRKQVARDVLRAVSALARPGVLPYVVSAICRSDPETAGAVVAVAIGLQPDDALIFTRAALCAAPSQTEQVVFSACRAAPASCAGVATVACRVLPAATELIRAGLTGARPDLELYLEEAELQAGTNDFQAVIKQAVQLQNDALKARTK